MNHDVTIKAVITPRFEVSLVRTPSDLYIVASKQNDEVKFSSSIADYKTADLMFDLTLEEVEGQ
jgi:hypothetical protein